MKANADVLRAENKSADKNNFFTLGLLRNITISIIFDLNLQVSWPQTKDR